MPRIIPSKIGLFFLLLVAASSTANADAINARATGLTSPQTTIDFGTALHDNFTVITNQFAGVTFSTDTVGDPWHYNTFAPGVFNGIESGHLRPGGVSNNTTIFSIEFDGPVSGAAFIFKAFTGNQWILTSRLGDTLVETFNFNSVDGDGLVRFYGFENSSFDTLTIARTVSGSGFELDNLQFPLRTCVLPPSGLIGWWDGDEATATIATDIQAGNDGTFVGDAATTAAGKVGDAFIFDGTGDFIQLPIDSGVIPNQFTIDAWVFPTKLTPFAFLQGIVDNDTTSPLGPRGVTLAVFGGVDFGGPDNNPMQVAGFFHNPDEAQHSTFDPATLPHFTITDPNEWHHYALTYDGFELCLYQDGVQDICNAATGTVIDNNINFRIGHGQADTSPERFFGGKIDEVEIYDRALTSAEILDIFNASTAGKCKGAVNEPPVAQCQNVTVPADLGLCSASILSVDAGSFDPDGDPITVDQSPPGGIPPTGPYDVGDTAVTLIVTDNAGAAASCSATVVVQDLEPPVIDCPSAQVKECTGSGGAIADISPTFFDNCEVAGSSCTPSSGSTFPLGNTGGICTATDFADNTKMCSFSVTVVDTTAPTVTAALVRIGGGDDDDDDGGIRVEFSCSDTCDATAAATATLNGIPVVNGQVVVLGDDDGIFGDDDDGIFGDDDDDDDGGNLELIATCTDASGQVGTATATLLVDDG